MVHMSSHSSSFPMAKMNREKKLNDCKSWSHKHDYPIEDVWNTSSIIAQLIVPRLKAFRAYDGKHGTPPDIATIEEWNKVFDKMIYAFELNMYAPGPISEQDNKDFQDGFNLFHKYY